MIATFRAHPSYTGPIDARLMASAYAQGLLHFCELGKVAMDSAIAKYSSDLSSNLVAISPSTLYASLQNDLINVVTALPGMVTQLLSLFTFAIKSEQFISGYGINAAAYISPYGTNDVFIAGNQYEMSDGSYCSCLTLLSCQMPAAIYFDKINSVGNIFSVNSNKTLIKGMQTDCYPFNGFLTSTLECYYDSSCLKLLVPDASSFSPLNSSLPSKFSVKSSVQDLMKSLMVEKFFFNYSAKALYEQCAPLACTYSYIYRSTVLAIIIFTVGLISGLNMIFRLIIPWIVDFAWKIKSRMMAPAARKPKRSGQGKSVSR